MKQIWVANSPEARHGVDVTGSFARGVASLRAHESYLRGLGPAMRDDPAEFLAAMARPVGSRVGGRYGVAFEVFPRDQF